MVASFSLGFICATILWFALTIAGNKPQSKVSRVLSSFPQSPKKQVKKSVIVLDEKHEKELMEEEA